MPDMSSAMFALRTEIVSTVDENNRDINEGAGWEGKPSDHPLVDAWNAVCEASPTVGIPEPITDEDF